jgi:hypothetical protein
MSRSPTLIFKEATVLGRTQIHETAARVLAHGGMYQIEHPCQYGATRKRQRIEVEWRGMVFDCCVLRYDKGKMIVRREK